MKLFLVGLLAFSLNAFSQNKIGSGVVKNYQDKAVAKAFLVNWTSPTSVALDIGTHEATITRNSTGDYLIAFAKHFERKPIVVMSASGDVVQTQVVYMASASSVRIKNFASDNVTASDGDFNVLVWGWESPDEY